jgi:D-alanyl-D-alanine carboxypeptidase
MSGNSSFKWPPFPRRDTKLLSLAPAHAGVKMNFAMRTMLVVVVALLTVCVGATPAATPKRANLGQLARTLVKSGSPGAIVYVRTMTAAHAGVAGWADRDAHVSMRAADRFRIASVTKAFVSVVILQLEAEGKLDIDDDVETYLPGLVPDGDAITLRELLNHTSGLFDYASDNEFFAALLSNLSRLWTPRELLAYAFAHAPAFPPGTNYAYSNTNYILLGLVAEAVTGKPLGQSLQERIFTPLGLTSTSFPLTIDLDVTFVHGYVRLVPGALTDATPVLGPSWAWAAGGIVSNARDVTTFYRGLLTGKLLRAAQLHEMETPSQNAGTYGLGIDSSFTACGRAFGHLGDFRAWRNAVLATANGRRQAVVMVNVDETSVSWARITAFAERALCRG